MHCTLHSTRSYVQTAQCIAIIWNHRVKQSRWHTRKCKHLWAYWTSITTIDNCVYWCCSELTKETEKRIRCLSRVLHSSNSRTQTHTCILRSCWTQLILFQKQNTHIRIRIEVSVARNATPCSPSTQHTNTFAILYANASDLLNHKLLTHFRDCQPAGVDG